MSKTNRVPYLAMCGICNNWTEYCDSCANTIRDPIPWSELFMAGVHWEWFTEENRK